LSCAENWRIDLKSLLAQLEDTAQNYPQAEAIRDGSMIAMSNALKIRDIVHRLEARGGQNQLIMFLTEPAVSGKSTAMQVAQQFCYDFCLAVGVMWSDTTFLFTAYTGAATSLFGGVTISKAAFLNQQKALSLNNKNTWQDVRILIVDEVSFMSDKNLNTLDVKLKEVGNRAKPFWWVLNHILWRLPPT
jgi:hypothetical protein